MKALREYFKELGNYGVGPEEAITQLGFDDAASYPKLTFTQKGYVPEKAIERVDTLLTSDQVKVATRQLNVSSAGPAIAAPIKAAQIATSAPVVDDAYEEDAAPAEVAAKPVKEKPTVAAVKASDELSAKLDSLFDE